MKHMKSVLFILVKIKFKKEMLFRHRLAEKSMLDLKYLQNECPEAKDYQTPCPLCAALR